MIDHLPPFIGLPVAALFWIGLLVMLLVERRDRLREQRAQQAKIDRLGRQMFEDRVTQYNAKLHTRGRR